MPSKCPTIIPPTKTAINDVTQVEGREGKGVGLFVQACFFDTLCEVLSTGVGEG